MLLYVDDALCVNHGATSEVVKPDRHFKMKAGLVGNPDIYLGDKISDFEVDGFKENETVCAWGLLPTKYATTAITNAEEYLAKQGKQLEKKDRKAAFKTGYMPELDISQEVDEKDCTLPITNWNSWLEG